MGLLFLSDERLNFLAVVEVVAQRVEHLGFGQVQGLGNVRDRFAALVQRGHVANRDAQAVNHRLTATNTLVSDDVRMFRLDDVGHAD